MDVIIGIERLSREAGRLLIAVGVFDGLHRGHRYLLARLAREARRRNARAAVVTFDHHPDEILVGSAPPLLCDPSERLARLDAAGVDVVVIEHFDAKLRSTTYDRFVRSIAERIELVGFVMTPDAAFGYERRGTPQAVAQLGARLGFEVVLISPLSLDGQAVRSSEIRAAIAAADFPRARRLLGRAVEVVGEARWPDVAGDDHDGSIAIEFRLPVALPGDGRYRTLIRPDGSPVSDAAAAAAVIRDGRLGLGDGRGLTAEDDRIRVRFLGREAGRP